MSAPKVNVSSAMSVQFEKVHSHLSSVMAQCEK
ncbi:unnamed protein product, partial [Nippostrongylus brasiliensis]|uniref:BLOC-1-related complex subunit 7 n=1 Tax=Nippostrongylus brasiliensis TaxID=27835 RepID=A0A0N4XSJ3_NIPBR